jgi:hypothetical protein
VFEHDVVTMQLLRLSSEVHVLIVFCTVPCSTCLWLTRPALGEYDVRSIHLLQPLPWQDVLSLPSHPPDAVPGRVSASKTIV